MDLIKFTKQNLLDKCKELQNYLLNKSILEKIY